MRSVRLKSVYIVLSFVCVCAPVVFVLFSNTDRAQATHNGTFHEVVELHGYMWSDTVGWISMNCAEGGPNATNICATSNYKVQINPNSGRTVTGYAWSDNVGWIKFVSQTEMTDFPANVTTEKASHVHLTGTPHLSGFARACAVIDDPNCTGSVLIPSDERGGWDGWISLRADNVNGADNHHSIILSDTGFANSDTAKSFAWGSDVIGWVDADGVTYTTPCTASVQCNATGTGIEDTNAWCELEETACGGGLTCNASTHTCGTAVTYSIVGDFTPSALVVRKGNTVTFDWDVVLSSVPPTGAGITSCRVEGSNGDNLVGGGDDEGSVTTSVLTLPEITYTLFCTPDDGNAEVEGESIIIKTLPYVLET